MGWRRERAEPQASEPALDDQPSPPAVDLPYTRRRYLLTQAERDSFAVLQAPAPEGWYVFPQVRLANLVMLKKGPRNWKPHSSRVAQKCVDFVLCDSAEISPRLVVELAGSSHDRPDRQARDQFVDAALSAADLPILHVRWQRQYDRDRLAQQIAVSAGLAPAPLPQPHAPLSPRGNGVLTGSSSVPPRALSAVAAPAPAQRSACRSCNAEVSATAKFCKVCGVQLGL